MGPGQLDTRASTWGPAEAVCLGQSGTRGAEGRGGSRERSIQMRRPCSWCSCSWVSTSRCRCPRPAAQEKVTLPK